MVNYGEAFKRPFTDFTKLIIGVLLSILPIVNFLAIGYLLECVKTASKKKFDLPEWENWGDLFVNGFFVTIIGIIYLIPAAIAFSIAVFGSIAFLLQGDIAGLIASALGISLVAGILLILGFYFGTAAAIEYAMTRQFGSAFSKNVFSLGLKGTFLGNFLLSMIIYAVVFSVLLFIPYVGAAVATFVSGVITYTILGEVYGTI